MTRRSGKHNRLTPAQRTVVPGAAHPSKGQWLMNGFLALFIITGAMYLLSSGPPAPLSDPKDRVGLPIIHYEVDAYGMRRAKVDEALLRQWCAANQLPAPPELGGAESTLIENFMVSLRQAEIHPNAETLGKLGKICESQLAHSSADEYFKRAADADPKDFRWPYYRGLIQQVTGKNEAAVELFSESVRLNPSFPATYARLGQLCLDLGQLDKANQHFQRFVEGSPNDWFGYLGQGRVALERGDLQNALWFLTEAEKRGPQDFQVRYYLGRIHQAMGNLTAAETYFAQARGLPQGAWFAGRDPLAQELRRAADSTDALVKEFERLLNSGDLPKLASLAEQIVQRRPDDVTTMSTLASIYRKLSRLKDARALVNRAMELAPNSARVVSVSAELLFAENRFNEALAAADRALTLDPETALAHGIRGRILLLQNQLAEAESAMRRAVHLRPDDASSIAVLGESLRLQGKTEEAIRQYQRALEIRPDYAAAKQRLDELKSQ